MRSNERWETLQKNGNIIVTELEKIKKLTVLWIQKNFEKNKKSEMNKILVIFNPEFKILKILFILN